MIKSLYSLLWVFSPCFLVAQYFERFPTELINSEKPIFFRQILPTTKGTVLIANSLSNLAEMDKMQIEVTWTTGYPVDNKGKKVISAGRSDVFRDLFELASGIKLIAEGPGKIVYFVTDNNHIGFINYTYGKNAFGFPPFVFPENRNQPVDIRKIWLDTKGNLFIGTNYDTLYIIEDAATVQIMEGRKWIRSTYKTDFDKDSNIVVTEGSKKIKKLFLGKDIFPTCFAADAQDDDNVLIGTNKGLFICNPSTGESAHIFAAAKNESLTITQILSVETSAFTWVSSLEKGLGRYTTVFTYGVDLFFSNPVRWFPYKGKVDESFSNPIQTFFRKSATEFYVAPLDSTPAVFNTESGKYNFLVDTSFKYTKNRSEDIRMDGGGNVYLIKGGWLFTSKNLSTDPALAEVKLDSSISQVVIIDVDIGKVSYSDHGNYEVNNTVMLKYYQNDISILYSARGFKSVDNLEFAYKLEGRDTGWSTMPYSMLDEKLNGAYFTDLDPGKYTFNVKVRKAGEDWRKPGATLNIVIKPPFWGTWWFWPSVIAGVSMITYVVTNLRARAVRKQEREKAKHEKELLEMEARALRAQMNPHFIFNSMNSIKALIQTDDKLKATDYLTTFSKLIRTLFNNADKKEISLYDEIETCKYYLQLESMRFDTKFSYSVNVDENIDLKSIQIPALIIQPFIENAIWHGIVPRNSGGHVALKVQKKNDCVEVVIDDDGIGRETSQKNKSSSGLTHQSKGVNLTHSRLELNNLLQQRQAKLEILDKKDESGKATGTTVIIQIKELED